MARRLMTHPGVGPLTALAFELVIGTPERFTAANRSPAMWGWFRRRSPAATGATGTHQQTRQRLLRFLLVEAAQVTVRSHAEWRSQFFHLAMRRGRKIAKVAMARKLAVQLYWMWRRGWDYEQMQKFGSHAGEPGNPHGVQ